MRLTVRKGIAVFDVGATALMGNNNGQQLVP